MDNRIERPNNLEKIVTGGGRKNYLDIGKLFVVLGIVNIHITRVHAPVWAFMCLCCIQFYFFTYGMAVRERTAGPEEWKKLIISRIKSLIVPYVLWAVIYASSLSKEFWINLFKGTNPSLGAAGTNMVLWFLPAMFTATIFFQIYSNLYCMEKGWRREAVSVISVIIGLVLSHFLDGLHVGVGFFGYNIAIYGCVFMIIGSRTADYIDRLKKIPAWLKLILAVLGFFIGYICYMRNPGTSMPVAYYGKLWLYTISALIAIVAVLLLAMLFEGSAFLSWMGKYTLIIMSVHHILYMYILPLCQRFTTFEYGDAYYAPTVAFLVFLVCIPLGVIINFACPQLNGKKVAPMELPEGADKAHVKRFLQKELCYILAFVVLFIADIVMSCIFIYVQPVTHVDNSAASEIVAITDDSDTVLQYFTAESSYIETVDIMIGTNAKVNYGVMTVGLYEADTDKLVAESQADISQFVDSSFCPIQFKKTSVNEDETYYLKLTILPQSESDSLAIFRTADMTATETNYAVINGERKDFALCIRITGHRY